MNRQGVVFAAAMLALYSAACAGSPKRPREVNVQREAEQQPLAVRPRSVLSREAINDIQRALRARGYEASVAGSYDRSTEDAVRKFQQDQGLAATGMPDFATLRSLNLDALPIYRDTLEP